MLTSNNDKPYLKPISAGFENETKKISTEYVSNMLEKLEADQQKKSAKLEGSSNENTDGQLNLTQQQQTSTQSKAIS